MLFVVDIQRQTCFELNAFKCECDGKARTDSNYEKLYAAGDIFYLSTPGGFLIKRALSGMFGSMDYVHGNFIISILKIFKFNVRVKNFIAQKFNLIFK